jgi:hypothetical protein
MIACTSLNRRESSRGRSPGKAAKGVRGNGASTTPGGQAQGTMRRDLVERAKSLLAEGYYDNPLLLDRAVSRMLRDIMREARTQRKSHRGPFTRGCAA